MLQLNPPGAGTQEIATTSGDPQPVDVLRNPPTSVDLFLGAFGRVNLALGGGLAVIASVLLWHFVPSTPVPLWIIALVGIPFLMWFASLALALRAASGLLLRQAAVFSRMESERFYTEIVDAVRPSAPEPNCSALLIVKWSQVAALPVGSNVVVTAAETHHERHIGLGTVREKNHNGNYVVSIDELYDGDEVKSFIRLLMEENSKPTLLKKLRISSTISIQKLSPRMLFSATRPPASAWTVPLPRRPGISE